MAALQSSRLRYALIPILVVLAVVAMLVLWRGKSPADQRVELPFDFRQTAGTSTDSLISSLQQQIRANPKNFDAHIELANAYLQKVRETGDPTLYTRAEALLDEAQKLQPKSPELFAPGGPSPSRATTSRRRWGTEHGPWPPTRRAPATTASWATPRSNWACTTMP